MMFPEGWRIYSAGTVAAGVSRHAIEAMQEIGIDISGQRSKTLEEVPCGDVGYVITLCDNARAQCPVFPAAKFNEHWPIVDPLFVTDLEPMQAMRRARDEIGDRMKDLVRRIANVR